jgi:hypothetical protein
MLSGGAKSDSNPGFFPQWHSDSTKVPFARLKFRPIIATTDELPNALTVPFGEQQARQQAEYENQGGTR